MVLLAFMSITSIHCRTDSKREKVFSDEFAKTPVYISRDFWTGGNTTDKKPCLLFISRHRKREAMSIKVSIANV